MICTRMYVKGNIAHDAKTSMDDEKLFKKVQNNPKI